MFRAIPWGALGRPLGLVHFFGCARLSAPMLFPRCIKKRSPSNHGYFGTFFWEPFGEVHLDHPEKKIKKGVPMQRGARFVFSRGAPMQRGARSAFCRASLATIPATGTLPMQ